MKNFEFKYKGKSYWYSRSVAVLGMVIGKDTNGNKYILANQRGENTPDFQGYWCMPCGYLDFNETTEQAVAREVFEETGVKLPCDYFLLHSIDSIPEERQNITIRYMFAPQVDIHKYKLTAKYSEHKEVDNIQWIPLDKIDDYQWAFNHKELIYQYIIKI